MQINKQKIQKAHDSALELVLRGVAASIIILPIVAIIIEAEPDQAAQAGTPPIIEGVYSPPPKTQKKFPVSSPEKAKETQKESPVSSPEKAKETQETPAETKPFLTDEVKAEPKKSGWTELVDYAKTHPFQGPVFTEDGFRGNHLQIALELRMPLYQNIQGCHPFLIAALHYTETGLQMSNGSNGQGVFQAYSSGIRYPANSYPDDFAVQAQRACDTLKSKGGVNDLSNIEDFDAIAVAFARYNGCWSPGHNIYANTVDTWRLCPYTANKMNASSHNMLQCAVDGCSRTNIRSAYGTMAFVAHLIAN